MSTPRDPDPTAARQTPPLAANRPSVDGQSLSPDQLRAQLAELRADLGETVEELVQRLDVPARARARKDEIVATARQRVAQLRTTATRETVHEQPARLGTVAGVLAVVLLVWLVRRRRRRASTPGPEGG